MRWYWIVIILCSYGVLKEFRPSEPYLYQYQHENLKISEDTLNGEVYPYWTYSYLVALIPALLLTDILLYKPILILESLSYIGCWLTLIFGRSVFSQIAGQIFYGCATATEVAYFSYIYVKVEPKDYARTTSWTRAALQAGKCVSYFLSELIILTKIGGYQTLNYISLTSLSLTFIFANMLPFVGWKEVVTRETELKETINDELTEHPKISESYKEFVLECVKNFARRTKKVFTDLHVLKWSFWWAMATCGQFQVGNYIQTLWAEEQPTDADNYNGFVEAANTMISTIIILLLQKLEVNWNKWGEFWLAFASLFDFGILLFMALTKSLWVMYIGYAIFRVIYQAMITIAQYNIVCRISPYSYGFVFGMDTFIALALQTILTTVVVNEHGLNLPIRTQFVVYSGFYLFIGLVFFIVIISRLCVAYAKK
uniref:Reduced folate carrier n=1 Tax=Acrobeloides nanus TaxID=290746 RepID=A0A914DWM1_9BILA